MELQASEVTQIFTIYVGRGQGKETGPATIQFVHVADSSPRSPDRRPNRTVTGLVHVIHALARREAFIPYRNSKLTRWLQPAMGVRFVAPPTAQLNTTDWAPFFRRFLAM
eukprot:symbB.v1.2.041404.t1/scaffold8154.1/size9163/1